MYMPLVSYRRFLIRTCTCTSSCFHALQVTVSAKANTTPAMVLSSSMVCGSWLHTIDAVLLPVANISQTPEVSLGARVTC